MTKTYSNDFYGGFLAGIEFERNRANSMTSTQIKEDVFEDDDEAFWINCLSEKNPHMGMCSRCEFVFTEAVSDEREILAKRCPSCGRKMKIRKYTWRTAK